jgi:beta-lactamase regulating signal transducer with metallopeptidase domain
MTPNPYAWSAAIAGLLSGLLPALAVAAAAWVLLKVSPGTNAASRHAVWWLVLALAVLLPLGFAVGEVSQVPARPWLPTATLSRGPAGPIPFVPGRFVAAVPQGATPYRPAVPAGRFASGNPVPSRWRPAAVSISPAAPLQLRAGGWSRWFPILWAGIFAAQLGRLAWSYGRLRGIKLRSSQAPPELSDSFRKWAAACAIRRPVRLLISDDVATPLAAGFLHPAVIVPFRVVGEFGKAELEHILLHELSHLARRDDWSNLAARVASAALWCNPAAVWALRRIEREREMACDEWVVAATGSPRPYAASLARLFEFCIARRKEALAAGMAGHASQLGERIETLVRRKGAHTRGISIPRVAGCTAVLLPLVAVVARMPRCVVLAQSPPVAVQREVQSGPRPTAALVANGQFRTAAPDPHSFLESVVAAGYGDLPVDDIIALRKSGVTAGYLMGISRAGWGKLKTHDMIDLHNHGVPTDFLRAVGAAHIPGLTIQGVIDLAANGVTARYVAEVQSAGMGAFPKDRIVEFHRNGVSPALLTALRDAGFTRLDSREIVAAQNNGLCPRDLRVARRYSSSLTLQQVLKLKQAGVL